MGIVPCDAFRKFKVLHSLLKRFYFLRIKEIKDEDENGPSKSGYGFHL